MKSLKAVVAGLLLAVTVGAVGQSSAKLPCDYSGKLLRKDNGEIVRFESNDMKGRATHKTDLGGFMKQTDIKGTAVIDVLVGPSGEVVCEKMLAAGHPIIRVEVEKALRNWTFKVAKMGGDPVAYLGRLEFYLCNIDCGDQGSSMTLLK